MKPVSSIVRRADGLRVLECRFLTLKGGKGKKERVVESRLLRLRPYDSVRSVSAEERRLLRGWHLLGKATHSERTYRLLVDLLEKTTAAPVCHLNRVPVLGNTPVDIRPWLCDPDAIANLLQQLRIYDDCFCSDEGVCDPWMLARCGQRILLGEVNFAPVVWERAFGWCHQVDYEELKRIERAYLHWLDEEMSQGLAEMILGHCQGVTGAKWLNLFSRLPEDIRRWQVEEWMRICDPRVECSYSLEFLAVGANRSFPENGRGLNYLWRGVAHGVDARQLEYGILLWRGFGWDHSPDLYQGVCIDSGLLARLITLIVSRKNQSAVADNLWDAMHIHPQLETSYQKLFDQPQTRRGWLLRLLRETRHDTRDDDLAHAFNRDFIEVAGHLEKIPAEYCLKAVSFFEAVYWCRSTDIPAGELMGEIATLCCKPFTTAHHGEWVWRKLLRDWKVVDLPMSSWKRIDQAWRSRNQTQSLEEGLDRLHHETLLPVIRDGLRLRVRLCLDVLKLAGQTLKPLVKRAMVRLQHHPLFDVSVAFINGLDALMHIMGGSKDFEIWRSHLLGERRLRPEVREQLLDKIEGQRMELLLTYLKNELMPVDQQCGLDLHTRLYSNAADENKRAYRKLVQRYRSLGEQGILAHPRNQYWLKTHPYVKQGIWLTGLRAEIELEDGRRIFLEMERRFEQVLKMGTLVNSCLALDGCNSHSALANAADVNKQVIMAYDSKQRFLGRQLVAIAEQRKLVVFDVYGEESHRLIPAFAAFDFQLGQLMALPLHREGDYDIEKVVCREWYDDYPWVPSENGHAKILDRQWGGSRVYM